MIRMWQKFSHVHTFDFSTLEIPTKQMCELWTASDSLVTYSGILSFHVVMEALQKFALAFIWLAVKNLEGKVYGN